MIIAKHSSKGLNLEEENKNTPTENSLPFSWKVGVHFAARIALIFSPVATVNCGNWKLCRNKKIEIKNDHI